MDKEFAVLDFRHLLGSWYESEGRDFPWRRTRDPWAILVSEVMLQQTTIATIEKRYEAWMEQFPSPKDLAQASESVMLRSWEGLGYYNRVRNLQKTAQAVTKQGGFPQDKKGLLALSGIGPYTAAAVASFAFHQPEALVDANVARVFARLFDDETPVDTPLGMKLLAERAEALLDRERPHLYNNALMELGQVYCKKMPECLLCPVRSCCQTERAEELPVKLPKRERVQVKERALLAYSEEKKAILLAKSTQKGRRQGFWRLPLRQEEQTEGLEFIATYKYTITHHQVELFLYKAPESLFLQEGEEWIALSLLSELPMASPDRKILLKQKELKALLS